jgi:hypothetical protein
MHTNTIEAAHQEDIVLLNKLTKVLEEQINVIHNSDMTGRKVEALAEQTQVLVNEIAQKHLLDLKQFKEQREHLQRLYNNLSLAIIARKGETENHLNKIRKGRKTIGTYRVNI